MRQLLHPRIPRVGTSHGGLVDPDRHGGCPTARAPSPPICDSPAVCVGGFRFGRCGGSLPRARSARAMRGSGPWNPNWIRVGNRILVSALDSRVSPLMNTGVVLALRACQRHRLVPRSYPDDRLSQRPVALVLGRADTTIASALSTWMPLATLRANSQARCHGLLFCSLFCALCCRVFGQRET